MIASTNPNSTRSVKKNAAEILIDKHIHNGDGGRTAVLQLGRPDVSYAELLQNANRLSNKIRDIGIQPGERVAILIRDSQEFIFAFLACLKTGAIAVPFNTFADGETLADMLSDCEAVALITENHFRETVDALPKDHLPNLKHIVFLDDDESWQHQPTRFGNCPRSEGDDAFWLYTSGSTGRPKAVIHCHGAIAHCANAFGRDILQITPDDRCFSTSKLFFAYGLGNSLIHPLTHGASIVLNSEKPNSSKICDIIRSFQPTLFFSVPTIYNRLLNEEFVDVTLMSSIRLCASAGEYLPPLVLERWMQACGQPIFDGIGATEAMHIYCSNRPSRYRAGSSGEPVDGYKLRIVDEQGNDVARGEIGQLLVRGKTFTKGYWNREEATTNLFDGEWYCSGDLFFQDQEGFYHYSGRHGDSFKSYGLWVSPVEIEQALLIDEDVDEAAVIATGNQEGLIRPKAFVKPVEIPRDTDDSYQLGERLKQRLSHQLPRYKMPHEIEIVEDFPRTATGKVARQRLREAASIQ